MVDECSHDQINLSESLPGAFLLAGTSRVDHDCYGIVSGCWLSLPSLFNQKVPRHLCTANVPNFEMFETINVNKYGFFCEQIRFFFPSAVTGLNKSFPFNIGDLLGESLLSSWSHDVCL